ncbi:cilia- and flagella-associated protein 276 isoform X2 [Scleropages formosus]|uniref:cilia- and flagella-associated protein 276 isoform X2 n=1 Tax=Scleropages formosus TaxID=113540 RepID=UPI0008782C84|nr:uncharacterized protein C1orf194 homolog isoform X2 [Scleropages formosus]
MRVPVRHRALRKKIHSAQVKIDGQELPLHLAQKEQPWHRLHEDPTLASSRRHYLHFESQAPKDSLDLHLKATYDHHQDFLWSKNQTLYQKETFTDDHGRSPKNQVKEQPRGHGTERAKLRVWIDPQKSSIYSVKGPIESHHIATTNRGYSRKQDGGFFCA